MAQAECFTLETRRMMGRKETSVNGKKSTKKKGAIRPWLVDVSLDHLR
jgi:hypothetical protein